MRLGDILGDRVLSSFFVSVGTGLALESLFEPTSERIDNERIHENYNINDFSVHYFNVSTLIRNIVNAINDKEKTWEFITNPKSIAPLIETIVDETTIIAELYRDTKCRPIFFIPDYKELYRNVPTIKPIDKLSKSDRALYTLTESTLHYMRENNRMQYLKIKHKLPSSIKDTIITTHVSHDLLNYTSIPHLKLLESHTGIIKDQSRFNTKYHSLGKLNTDLFPFLEELLYFLGDKGLLLPNAIGLRRQLHQFAIEKKWTAYTTRRKVRDDLQKYKSDLTEIIMGYKLSY